jgi:imidazole glycerol-phosphate synthase subunit HisH
MNKIGIINYGLGNFGSVVRMIEKIGRVAHTVSTPADLLQVEKLILPGVGHFDNGMRLLEEKKLSAALKDFVSHPNHTLLGICLGMQLLFDGSDEGAATGLGLIPGRVVRFDNSKNQFSIPRMGWCTVAVQKENPLIPKDLESGIKSRFYFVHSYYAKCQSAEDVLATVDYDPPVTAAVSRKNIYGVQFHPEKSHRFGMALMTRFAEL